MLVLGLLFMVLVAGPLLVLGVLALANNERARTWLDGLRRRVPAPVDGGVPTGENGTPTRDGHGEAADGLAAAESTSAP